MDAFIYVYGNGDFIYNNLTSLNFFMNNARSFFEVSALFALLLFAVQATGILPGKGGADWMHFIRMYLLMQIFVLVPYTGSVTVQDVLTNQNYVYNSTNSRLPFGLVMPISLISETAHKLITLYQKNFSIDSNLNYTYSGMNFGANFIQGLDNVNSYDDKFNYNLDNYMQNCGFPLLHKAGATNLLRSSSDIFATLAQYTSDSRYVQQVDFSTGNPVVDPCSTALSSISAYYDSNKDKFMQANAQHMGIAANGEAFTRFMNAANATTSTLLNISQGASTALKQAMAMNMIMTSVKDGAQAVGNGTLALAAYDAEQFQQYKKGGELSGASAARTIPILVGLCFALLFILYPVMIFLAIAMGSYKAVGTFFQIIITINLIPLIYEILNFFTTAYLQKKLGVVITGSGYSYDLSTSIYSFTDNMISATNWLATSTPLIAYAIVTGSGTGLTSIFSHVTDAAKSITSGVANDYTKGNQNIGNISLDNASFDNVQGNKMDDQLSMNNGSPIMKHTSPGGIETNIGGKEYDQNFKNDLLTTPNMANIASSSLQNSLSHSKQDMLAQSKQWTQTAQRMKDYANSMQSSQGTTTNVSSEQSKQLSHAAQLASDIGVQLKSPLPVLGGGIGVSDKLSDDLQSYKREMNNYQSSIGNNATQDMKDAFNKSNSLIDTTSKTVQQAVTTSQALTDVKTNQSSVNTNLSNDFAQHLRNQGFDPNNMSAFEQDAQARNFVSQEVNKRYGIKDGLSSPSTNLPGTGNNPSSAPNDYGIAKPNNNNTTMGNPLMDENRKAIRDFDKHQGDTLGRQIKDQGTTLNSIRNDAAIGIGGLVEEAGEKIKATDISELNLSKLPNMDNDYKKGKNE